MQGNRRHLSRDYQAPDFGCQEWDCENDAEPDAPVALCGHHLRLAYAYVRCTLPGGDEHAQALVSAIADFGKHRVAGPRRRTERLSAVPGHVYFLRRRGLIKIGWSADYLERVRSFRDAVLMHAEPGTMRDEQRVHVAFQHLRLVGERQPHAGRTEWFREAPELLAFINNLKLHAA